MEIIVLKVVHSTFQSQNFVFFNEKLLILDSLICALSALRAQDNKTL